MKFFNLLLFSFLVISTLNSQTIFADTHQSTNDENNLLTEKNIPLENSFVTEINLTQLKSDLASVPMENEHDSENWGEISIPFPDGSFKTVKIEEAPVMEQAMYDAYPEIKTYRISGRYISGRLSVTTKGLNGLIFSDGYSFFIEPLAGNLHVSYKMSKSLTDNMTCGVIDDIMTPNNQNNFSGTGTTSLQMPPSNGADLKNFRIAIASSGEFTIARGSTLTLVNDAITIYLNALNAIFESELSMTFTLIADNDDIIFFDPATDGLDVNNRTTTAHNVINSTIGSANYDLGHVFHELPSPGPGFSTGSGIAGLGVVCRSSFKGRGWTGAGGSYSTAFFMGIFSHEVGHQFNASHTFYGTSGNCNASQRSPGNGFEPGSGNTIMSYEGSCFASGSCTSTHNITPQVATAYFHIHSLIQMIEYTTTGFGTCSTISSTGNNLPVVTVPANTTIPKGTPFELEGSATDGDGDPLVYIWEQYDFDNLILSCPDGHPNDAATSTTAPLFRSFDPSSGGASRTFPQLDDILANSQTQGEILPQVARDLHFRLIARDGEGGIDYEETEVVIDNNSGPFEVLTGNSATGFQEGSNQVITWDVAGTTNSPVNCGTVNILFSTDGGQTFPTTLATATTNDGSESVTIPSTITNQGRIKIECANNIFFDINNLDIAVVAAGCLADAESISNDDAVNEEEGAAALDLSLLSGTLTASISGEITNSDPNSPIALDNGTGTCTAPFSNSPGHHIFSFSVDRDETYTFTAGSGSLPSDLLTLYEVSFNSSSVCTNWLSSNVSYTGSVNYSNSNSRALEKGKQYVLVISGFSTGNTGTYNISITSSGTGQVFDNSNFPASGYASTYVIVNNTTGNIVAFDANTDLSNGITYPAESYTIHGVVNLGGINLASYVGGSFANFQAAISNSTICADLSSNSVAVTIVPTALPIELLSFTGKQQNETTLLNWKTSTEINNDFFTLEHSLNGYQFEFLTKVDGKGNSTITSDYRFVHQNPTVGTNYYRLSQTDFDGTTKEAGVIAVDFKSDKVVATVIPNPIRQNEINLNYISPQNSEVEIEVIDMTGKVLIQTTVPVSEGENNIQLPIQNWASGVYYLRTIQNQTIKSVKFVKTN
ncbi:MAG: reprolysin-like metallopeptidase [Saprospiraceae bacterium]